MLKVNNLGKDFKIHIREGLVIDGFKQVNFQVKEGTLLAITGESGAGKSSLLKCIYKTYLATTGEVLYRCRDGSVIDILKASDQEMLMLRKTELGYVSQFLHVIPRISAKNLLKDKIYQFSGDEVQAESEAEDLLKKVRINENLWNMYPSTFSGGEKQRLNILLALAAKPRFLLLDEPTASLDPNSKNIIHEMILDAKEKGTTMIGVFHDKEDVRKLADDELKLRN